MPGSNMKRKQAPVSDEELLVHGSDGQESSHDAGDSALRAKRAHIEADLAALDDAVPPSDNDAETEDLEARRASTHEKYNALKTYKGQYYSGMAVGGSHTWNYDPGVWHEVKQEPDLWKIDFNTKKRRARKAPTGSGAPVGTEYHWLIVEHQVLFSPAIALCTKNTNFAPRMTVRQENGRKHIRDDFKGLKVQAMPQGSRIQQLVGANR